MKAMYGLESFTAKFCEAVLTLRPPNRFAKSMLFFSEVAMNKYKN